MMERHDVVNIAAYREDLLQLLAASASWDERARAERRDSPRLRLAIDRVRAAASVGERHDEQRVLIRQP